MISASRPHEHHRDDGAPLGHDALESARDNLRFFSNEGKPERERWVFDAWASCRGHGFKTVRQGEAPDFMADGLCVEVVEVMEPRRRRGDQYRAAVAGVEAGRIPYRWNVPPRRVLAEAATWIAERVAQKSAKYSSCAADWLLVVYANYTWWDRTDWGDVRYRLADIRPPFKRVDVLSNDGGRVEQIWP